MQFAFAVLALLVSITPQSAAGSNNGRINSTPTNARAAPIDVKIDAVGDVMMGWRVRALVQTDGTDAPFKQAHATLVQADAIVGNLECPLSDRGKPTKSKSAKDLKARKEFLLRGTPAAAAGLAHAGFAALTLANNHILDYGKNALDDTLQALHDSGIATAGAGDDAALAWQPAFFERRGVRFALLGVSEVIPRGYGATAHAAGVAPGRDPSTGDVTAAYLRMLAHAIRMAHANADVVIVYEHWGTELLSTPTADHIRLAHAAIDAGASIVLGAHPHVLGPVEAYHGGLIAYSLGNFIFDTQPGIQTRSAVLEISLHGSTVSSWRAVPMLLEQGVPRPAAGPDAAYIQQLLSGQAASIPPATPAPPVARAPAPAHGHDLAAQHPAAHGPPQ
jgi:poly-gamma-glutamate synthesis protein (capsule biosynthesis protein)